MGVRIMTALLAASIVTLLGVSLGILLADGRDSHIESETIGVATVFIALAALQFVFGALMFKKRHGLGSNIQVRLSDIVLSEADYNDDPKMSDIKMTPLPEP